MSQRNIKQIKKQNYQFKRNSLEKYEKISDDRVRRIYERLYLVAMSVFEWKNLPPSIDPLFLERNLITHGSLVFFKDEDMKESLTDDSGVYWVMKYMFTQYRDVYGNPIQRRAYADHGVPYRKELNNKDSVIIYDNILRTQFDDIIYDFAKQLANVKAVIDSNLDKQKMPYLVAGTDELKDQLNTFFDQKSYNKEYFIIKPNMIDELKEALQVVPLNVDLIVDKLNDYYDALWNEFMIFVGIGTNVSPKRERLVSSEVESVNEQSSVFAQARLKARKRACEQINLMFNLSIEVDYAVHDMNPTLKQKENEVIE